MNCQLDKYKFTCCQCGGKFSHVDGTWLPVAVGTPDYIRVTAIAMELNLTSLLREPEVITSDEFTCYDCL